MSNIFIIESPFQLSNSMKIQSDNDYLIVRMNGDTRNDQQMDALLKKSKGKIYKKTIKSGSKKELFIYMIMFFVPIIILNYRKRLIIGNYDSLWMKTVAYLLKPFDFYVLDDGLVTIRMIKKLDNRISNALFINKLIFKCFCPTFITKYNIKTENLKIIKLPKEENNSIIKKIKKDSVCFIGSPLVEKNVISKESFIKSINEIGTGIKASNRYFKYYPHRAEVFCEDVDFIKSKIISSDLSIESYYDYSEELPEYFLSFYSSALINLKEKYPDCKFISYMINPSEINEEHRDVVLDAYFFLEQSNFKVVKL
ncbi:hypothetical protein [Photobacterium leiognathi]|uniref:hypothetical protein n=1 Tax=Photobacterium leiognathi TaxID=553611 RepID=UPI002980B525|nr:hypothetical protein [Photobacterium leiognathi]